MGEFVDALRCLGARESSRWMRRAMDYVMRSQLPDGSWDSFAGRDPYTAYHGTMVGIQVRALLCMSA